MALLSTFGGRKMVFMMARANRKDLEVLRGLLESGKIAPVIGRRYTLAEIPEAIRYLGQGHSRGKTAVAIEMDR